MNISDGSIDTQINPSDIVSVSFEPSEFSSSYDATWFYVSTDTEELIADSEHMDSTDWERLQTVADSDYYSSDATNDYE